VNLIPATVLDACDDENESVWGLGVQVNPLTGNVRSSSRTDLEGRVMSNRPGKPHELPTRVRENLKPRGLGSIRPSSGWKPAALRHVGVQLTEGPGVNYFMKKAACVLMLVCLVLLCGLPWLHHATRQESVSLKPQNTRVVVKTPQDFQIRMSHIIAAAQSAPGLDPTVIGRPRDVPDASRNAPPRIAALRR
jgi:hypothetical protein